MDNITEPMKSATPASGRENATILIVEDSPVQAELLRRALESTGYTVIAARDGAEGLALARAKHPAAVVSDINMPIMDGYAMCLAIRRDESLKSTPVILLTMLSDPQDVIHGLNAGADAYVTKPYNVPTLIARVESLLAYPPVPPPPVERRKVAIRLDEETHLVDAHGPRMLNLLVSTYENAVLQNRDLIATQQALEDLNQHLEQKVLEKTAEVQASEQRFRSLIEHASDLVALIDAHGVISYISPSIRQLGGYDVAEVRGTQYLDYVHPEDQAAAISSLSALMRDPQALHRAELRFRHKDGTWKTVESVSRNALDDPAIEGIVINARDVTERKRAEEAIAKLNRLYATLSGINMAIVHAASPVELFERICDVAVEQGKFGVAWIGTVEHADEMITPVAQRGLSQDDTAKIRDSIGRIGESRSRAATAIREARIVYTNDYGAEAFATTWRGAFMEWSIRGYAALPISQRGKIVGLLALYVKEQDFFDSQQLALLEEMRADISFAMDRFDIEAEKARAETELRRLNWALRALGESNSALVHAGTEKDLFHSCCEAIAGAGTYPLAWIGVARDDDSRSIEIAAAAGEATAYLDGIALSWADTPLGRGPAGTAIRTGATLMINDLARDEAYLPWIERARTHGLVSSISLPIRTDASTIGTLVVFAREPDAFGPPEVKLFEELAADIGYGIVSRRVLGERDRLLQEQILSIERLKDALIGTIGAVALTVEKRDPYTAGHQQRVAELCVAIGRKLDFSADRLEGLRLGATIHDIGKIYVPAEILNRPGKLSAPEFEIIKSHPQVGYDIVKDVKFPWPVTDMILQHHERLDGSGYPQGLKGDAIILEARILAVADVIEAMSSHRPYRPGLGLVAALAQITKEAGTTLDAQVVDACERLIRDGTFSLKQA